MPRLIFILAVLMACSPQQKKRQEKFSVLEESFVSGVVIFPQDESITTSLVFDKADQLLKHFKHAEESRDSMVVYDSYTVLFARPGDPEFNMPNAEELGAALSDPAEEEIEGLQKTKSNILFTFSGTKKDIINKQRAINDFIYAIIKNKKALVLDLNAFKLFTPSAWRESRIEDFQGEHPNIAGQVILHFYREENELCRIVTMGMNKFCLPEISIKGFPCSEGNTYSSLVNASIQSIYEAPYLSGDSTFIIDLDKIRNDKTRLYLTSELKDKATRKGVCHFKYVEPEQGDNPSPQLEIRFNDNAQGTSQQQAAALIAGMFGAKDSLAYSRHDEELLRASENAKHKLPEIQSLFKKGLEPGYSILVKVPFKTDDGREWMWVEVTEWNGNQMAGILQNDSYYIPDLKAGAMVNFEQADIFDYILNKPDGSFEGNETGKMLETAH